MGLQRVGHDWAAEQQQWTHFIAQQKLTQHCKQLYSLFFFKNSPVFKEKIRAGGLKLLDFKTYYKVTINKIVYYFCQDRQIDQWNGI